MDICAELYVLWTEGKQDAFHAHMLTCAKCRDIFKKINQHSKVDCGVFDQEPSAAAEVILKYGIAEALNRYINYIFHCMSCNECLLELYDIMQFLKKPE